MPETQRRRLTLLVTILGSSIVFLDATVVNVALPAIERDLDTGLAGQQWVVEAYLLALVALLLVGGSLGDLFGRRRLFTIGLAGFGATSALCALAPSEELLVAGRALQGMAGALLVPGSLAIIAATFDEAERGKAVGAWTAWAGITTVAGPAGGGFLVDALSWRWVFWINLPLVLGTIYLTRRTVRESSDPEACPGIDVWGIVLSAAGLGGPVYALIQQPTHGWSDPQVLIPLIGGAAVLAAFIVHESRAFAPMLPLSLFRSRNFSVANLATLAVYAGLIGSIFFVSIFLQQVAGYTPFQAGLATTPVSVLLFLLSARFGALAQTIGPRLPMGVGPLIAGAGLLLLLRVGADGDYLASVLPALVPFGLGLAMTVAPLTTTVLNSVEERRAGIASGVNNAVSRVAGLLAIAALGAVISAQFASAIDDRLDRGALGPPARAAIAEAKSRPLAGPGLDPVPAADRAELGPAIEDSSVSAFHLGVGIAAALVILGGLVSAMGIRNPERLRPEPEPAPSAATAGECGRVAAGPAGEPEPVLTGGGSR